MAANIGWSFGPRPFHFAPLLAAAGAIPLGRGMLVTMPAAALTGAIAAGAALGAYGYCVEPRWFQLRHEVVRPVRRPPRPFRVLHISDGHFTGSQPWKERFFRSLGAYAVDFAFLVGDLIEDDGGIAPLLRGIAALRPRYGTYCVLAAHDFLYPGFMAMVRDVIKGGRHHTARNDGRQLMRELRAAGVHMFRNDGFTLGPGTDSPFPEPVFLCGVNDAFMGWDNVARAIRHKPDGLFSLMLSHALHEYDDILAAAPDVCLAGHAHGGQVRVPFYGAVITRSSLHRKFARGVFRQGRTTFHLNHGLGSGRWTHYRFNCRPQATILDIS